MNMNMNMNQNMEMKLTIDRRLLRHLIYLMAVMMTTLLNRQRRERGHLLYHRLLFLHIKTATLRAPSNPPPPLPQPPPVPPLPVRSFSGNKAPLVAAALGKIERRPQVSPNSPRGHGVTTRGYRGSGISAPQRRVQGIVAPCERKQLVAFLRVDSNRATLSCGGTILRTTRILSQLRP